MVYPIAKLTIVKLVMLWVRNIEGLNNVPKDRPFIIACNHGSFFDDAILPCTIMPYLNNYFHIYVNNHFFKRLFFRIILKWGRCIPVNVKKTEADQKDTSTNKEALSLALKYLKLGEPIGIFPEGSRSFPDRMREGKTGAANLAIMAKVPIIPMGIKGSKDILPKGSFFIQPNRCDIKIGKPIDLSRYYGKNNDKKVLKEITNNLMKEIAKLAGEKYGY